LRPSGQQHLESSAVHTYCYQRGFGGAKGGPNSKKRNAGMNVPHIIQSKVNEWKYILKGIVYFALFTK
jgi:hypothetical protein